ncbi:nuclear factor erythroid 2-related factor 3 [Archocentrus centrarchus]|uniref:nuclear factor erythroid 2-related factor 3 n=1 Tax=Archocentrus centrarchus TaxID=63155 RepID=UPI0011EA30E5|nr:endoplasmic reticulum membrane sensor NFE2L1-like [Archocentrus centrarchus]XP_030596158.1 endoplasmic reticulum membrane sensor NFE2L1-like [Archocentrus centrarchus]
MQIAKKYFTESLIQLTILLSLIGVRVDIDSYLSGYYTPLTEINLGPSSAYIQTPFHILRDTLDGYGVHPKCPELDYFFASRRLLDEVRTLGSPRFHTQLNAWLVHQVPATDKPECGPSTSNSTDSSSGLESPGDESRDVSEHLPVRGPAVCQANTELGPGPCGAGACGFLKEEEDVKVKEEEEPAPISQLALSSTLERESLLEGITALSSPAHQHPPTIDIDQHWNNLLSVADLDDLDPLVTEQLSDLDADITSAISRDVSLHDAMLTSAGVFGLASDRSESRTLTQQQRALFRMESTGSLNSDASPGMALGLAALPFASVCNLTGNVSSHSALGDCLDEAVFDQINQLGLEGLDTIGSQLMDCLDSIDPQVLEDMESDSGLSLESSSGGPVSPGSSEMSSSSSSYCEDECGATGYSSEVDSVPSKGIMDYTTTWSPTESVWHDHSYSSATFFNQPSVTLPCKNIKEEPLSDDDGLRLEEQEMSRDELRARAMCLPFSVLQIVNMPVEEFLEVLDGHGFSPEQVTLLRDIRRRGKNKLAAQNCRKRKLDAITGLQEEVERLQVQRDKLLREKQLTAKTMGAVGHQIRQLTRDILARLRDESGQPLNPDRFTLQCGANGRVVVQPVRRPAVSTSGNKTDKRKKEKKQ